ncbi:MAG: toll/interleukin-1 receptor domain-containing protein [Pseudomonadota bacterium]
MKLFISHSSHEPENRALLQSVCDGFKANGYTVLVDEAAGGIPIGERWYKCIHSWLYECDAAIILFSNAATESDFVRHEVAVLSSRSIVQPDFRIFPVLIGDVRPEALSQGALGTARISDIQAATTDDPGEIVAKVAEQLGPAGTDQPQTPSARLAAQVRNVLKRNIVDESAYEGAWDDLGVADEHVWSPTGTVDFAATLTRVLLSDRELALERLATVLRALRISLDAETAEKLLTEFKCLWVDPRAANQIRAQCNETMRALAVSGEYVKDFTADCLVKRAWFPKGDKRFVEVSSADPDAIRQELASSGAVRRTPPSRRDRPGRAPRRPPRANADQLVVLAPGDLFADAQALRELRTSEPEALWLLDTGPEPPRAMPGGPRLIDPEVDADQEHYQYECYGDVRWIIDEDLRATG